MTAGARDVRTIAVVGAGLAAELAATALGARLGRAARLVLVRTESEPDADGFYGTTAGPWAKTLHDCIGVTEAALLRDPGTMLSWGTRYDGWGEAGRRWLQAYHQPFAPLGGAAFQHSLARLGLPLQPLLLPAVAAAAGVFAHPAGDPASPLSRAEYGYQFEPASLARILAAARPDHVAVRDGAIEGVRTSEAGVAAVTLSDGAVVEADLFVDATGPEARLAGALGLTRACERAVSLLSTRSEGGTAAPQRTVSLAPFGWTATTPLRGGTLRTSLCRPDAADAARQAHGTPTREARADVGRAASPWIGNCVAIGQAANVSDPLTTAPLLLLYRDVERLLGLVPRSEDAGVERREYTRRFRDDAEHAALFARAFEAEGDEPGSKLARKLAQFESRGVLVQYDFEPFHPEDWLILHEGIGRRPRRYDRTADRLPEGPLRRELEGRREAIAALVRRMPPAGQYLARYLDYLERNS